jgi:hypothetical protein
LAANGGNCAAGQYAQGVDASGVAEGCAALPSGSGSTGHVTYWTGTTTIGNDVDGSFYWDAGNNRMGIGTTNPQSKLSVGGDGILNAGVYGTGTTYGVYGQGGTYAGYFSGAVRVTGIVTANSATAMTATTGITSVGGPNAGDAGVAGYDSASGNFGKGYLGYYSSGVPGVGTSSSVGVYGTGGTAAGGIGVYGSYNGGNTYGYMGGVNYGVYGQYDANNKGYLGNFNTGVYGIGSSFGAYVYGATGIYAAGTTVAVDADNAVGTAVRSYGTLEVETGGLCISSTNLCSSGTATDGDVEVLNGLVRVLAGVAGTNAYATANGELYAYGDLEADGNIYGNSLVDSSGFALGTTTALCSSGAAPSTVTDCSGIPTDYAEYYAVELSIEAGDVVVMSEHTIKDVYGKSISRLVKSNNAFDTKVAGIVSTEPGHFIGDESITDPNEKTLPLALSGRVPVKVTDENGPISIGDLLTTSSTPGHAMKCPIETNEQKLKCMGAIVGKALEPLESGEGKIIALVTLQ